MRSKKTLIALLLVFIAPGVLAVLFYMNPNWLAGLPTNKGVFIRPAVKLSSLGGDVADKDKWHLVVWCPKGCGAACLDAVDEMARVRLALGRRLYQVDLWVLQGQTGVICNQDIAKAFKAKAIKTRALSSDEQLAVSVLDDKPKIFLADPNQYLVFEYTEKNKPNDVFQDLKRLLSAQEQT
ncbi:MAG: hypothetical protein QNK11_05690 [Legionella sp.]|nr:hypothetical protein [Legionella sp.]